jgi:hypothetical protein
LAERDYVVVNGVSDSSVSIVVGVVVVVVVIVIIVLKGIVCEVFKKKGGFKLVLKSFSYKYV